MIIRFWRPVRVYRNCVAWARQDSNLGPRDYESPALTAELQAQFTRERGNLALAQEQLFDTGI